MFGNLFYDVILLGKIENWIYFIDWFFLSFSWEPSCNSFKHFKKAWFGKVTLIAEKIKEILLLHSFF